MGKCREEMPSEEPFHLCVGTEQAVKKSQGHIIMTKSIAGIAIPDSKLSTAAADALREYGKPAAVEPFAPRFPLWITARPSGEPEVRSGVTLYERLVSRSWTHQALQ